MFDSGEQRMKCPYCDTEYDVEALAAYDEELKGDAEDDMHWESAAGGEWQEGEEDLLNVYVCGSCGGEIVCGETTAATSCPFCGSPVVISGRLSGALKPDCVIPFKLDKNAAAAALKAHYRGKTLLPRVFKTQNRIDEIKGVYVPFWLFDAEADTRLRCRATRVRTWQTSDRVYTETSFYSVIREGSLAFERVPVDGSKKMADELMESLEPFDFSEAVDFKTAYLSGYFADKYDVSGEQSVARANERIRKSAESAFLSTVGGYTTVRPEYVSVKLRGGKERYALYPVWLLNTTWRGNKYTFAVNGQTGRTAGDLPLDKGAMCRWLAGLTAAVSAAAFAVSYLIWLL